jgi:hypothetical protein
MYLRVSFLTRCFYYVKKIQPLIRIKIIFFSINLSENILVCLFKWTRVTQR